MCIRDSPGRGLTVIRRKRKVQLVEKYRYWGAHQRNEMEIKKFPSLRQLLTRRSAYFLAVYIRKLDEEGEIKRDC